MTITPEDVRIRTTHRAPDMAAELSLPDALNLTNRCDRCGAQALHAFAHNIPSGGYVILLFCNHHGKAHHQATHAWAAHHDYRMPMLDWEKEATTQRAKAKADPKGLTDPNPPTPIHLAMWDLDNWA